MSRSKSYEYYFLFPYLGLRKICTLTLNPAIHTCQHRRNLAIKLGGGKNNSAPFDLNLDSLELFSWKTTPQKGSILVLFFPILLLIWGEGPPWQYFFVAPMLVKLYLAILKLALKFLPPPNLYWAKKKSHRNNILLRTKRLCKVVSSERNKIFSVLTFSKGRKV